MYDDFGSHANTFLFSESEGVRTLAGLHWALSVAKKGIAR